MVRYFWQPILGWFSGMAICVIITSILMKLGWEKDNKEHILIWGYAMIGSASIFAWQVFRSMRSDDRKELDEKLKAKADAKDIEALKCQMLMLHDTLDLISKNQEEVHATVDNIWNKLTN